MINYDTYAFTRQECKYACKRRLLCSTFSPTAEKLHSSFWALKGREGIGHQQLAQCPAAMKDPAYLYISYLTVAIVFPRRPGIASTKCISVSINYLYYEASLINILFETFSLASVKVRKYSLERPTMTPSSARSSPLTTTRSRSSRPSTA